MKGDNMANLSSEMKALFESQLAVVATASKDGTPNVVPKGSLYIVDDQTLAYSEGIGAKTLRNLKENARIVVMAVDKVTGEGYQIKGTAELLSSGDLFQKMAKRQEERKKPPPKVVVRISAKEIYSVKSATGGKRIA
jgi:predicted pyridoxine 5'-phosphate oxidase superfamily flavin-nucleotide-binding protein